MRGLRRRIKYRLLACSVLSLVIYNSIAQEHLIQKPEHKLLRLAEEQYNQGHYRLATQSARRYLTNYRENSEGTSASKEKANYIKVLAALRLDDPGSDDSAKAFIARTGNIAYQQRASFALAQYYFRHESLNNAILFYESANISNLTNEEIADSKFELAYGYFNGKQFDKAEPLFASIKEVPGKYYVAGNYYYGLLAYNQGKYDDALTSFRRVDNEQQYKSIVPY